MAKQRYFPYLIGLSAVVFLAIVSIAIWKIPQSQVGSAPLKPEEKNRIDAETAARLALIQGVGGLLLFGTAAISFLNLRATQRNVEIAQKNALIAEEKQVTERFSKAVEMLGNENSIHIRLGGIYALERIANDSDKDYWQVMEVLTAYVRERSKWNLPDEQASLHEESGVSSLPTDIQATLTVIARRKHSYESGEEYGLDFNRTNLQRADLSAANLVKANLLGANLKRANLEESNLKGANLEKANLEGAKLERANLKATNLRGADLRGVDLLGTNPEEAYLEGANLKEIYLEGAKLKGAKLGRVNLKGANLERANLERVGLRGADLAAAKLGGANMLGADLLGANLEGADMGGADMGGANLIRANLGGANLKQAKNLTWEQLNQAKSYAGAQLPDYLIENQSPAPEQQS